MDRDKHLAVKWLRHAYSGLPRPRDHPDRPAQELYIDANLTWWKRQLFSKVARKDYALGLNLTGTRSTIPTVVL